MSTSMITTNDISQTEIDIHQLLRATAPAGIRTLTDLQKDMKEASKAWVATCMTLLWELEDDEIDQSVSPWTADTAAALDHLTATALYNSTKFAAQQPWSLRLSVGHYARPVITEISRERVMSDHGFRPRTQKVFACALLHDADDTDFEYGILCVRKEPKCESTLIVLKIVEERRGFASVKLEMHVIQTDVEAKDMTTGPIMAMIEIGKQSNSNREKTPRRRENRNAVDSWKLRPSRAASMTARRTPLNRPLASSKQLQEHSRDSASQNDEIAESSLKQITFIGHSLL